MKTTKRFIGILLAILMVAVLAAGCGGGGSKTEATTSGQAATAATQETTQNAFAELVEFSFMPTSSDAYEQMNAPRPNDVVTPYIEKKFNLKIKELTPRIKDQTVQQLISQLIAAGNVPDVVEVTATDAEWVARTGLFMDLTPYAEKMENYKKQVQPEYWDRTNIDGKQYSIHGHIALFPEADFVSDPYYPGSYSHALWVREDILVQLGYKLTPIDEIKKNTVDAGKKPTAEDMKIEPAISTPDDFYTLLKKIKDANLKVGDKPVIPLSIASWSQFHVGAMFDWGHWRINEAKEVDGWFGLAGAKEYYKFLNKLYQEGLIDQDFVIQKNEQLQQKVAAGRVAVGMWLPDFPGAQQAVTQVVPEARLRFIPWPKKEEGKGGYDCEGVGGNGFNRLFVNKDFKNVDRLIAYWDWLYSDEGQDLIAWGPEDAGIWKMDGDKKVFVDEEVKNAVLNYERNKKGQDYYGLYDRNTHEGTWSPIVAAGPEPYNFHTPDRSYPARIDFNDATRNLLGRNGVIPSGRGAYNDNSPVTQDIGSYFWGEFQNIKVAKILTAKTEADFEKAYEEIYNEFLQKSNYAAAREAMKKWFEKYPPIN